MSMNANERPDDLVNLKQNPSRYFQSLLGTSSQIKSTATKNPRSNISPQVLQVPNSQHTNERYPSNDINSPSSTESLSRLLFSSRYKPKIKEPNSYLQDSSAPRARSNYPNPPLKSALKKPQSANYDTQQSYYLHRPTNSDDFYRTEVEDYPKTQKEPLYRRNVIEADVYSIDEPGIQNNHLKLQNGYPKYPDTSIPDTNQDYTSQNQIRYPILPPDNTNEYVPRSYSNHSRVQDTSDYSDNNSYVANTDQNATYSVAQNKALKKGKVAGPGAFPKTALRYSQRRSSNNTFFSTDNRNLNESEQSPTSVLRKRVQNDPKFKNSRRQGAYPQPNIDNNNVNSGENYPQSSFSESDGFLSKCIYYFRSSLAFLFGKVAFFFLLIFYATTDIFALVFRYTVGLLVPRRWFGYDNDNSSTRSSPSRSTTTILTALFFLIGLLLSSYLSKNGWSNLPDPIDPTPVTTPSTFDRVYSGIWNSIGSSLFDFRIFNKQKQGSIPLSSKKRYQDLLEQRSKNIPIKNDQVSNQLLESYKILEDSIISLTRDSMLTEAKIKEMIENISGIQSAISDQNRRNNAFQHSSLESQSKLSKSIKNEIDKVLQPALKEHISKLENMIPRLVKSHKLTPEDHKNISTQIEELKLEIKSWVDFEVGKINTAVSNLKEDVQQKNKVSDSNHSGSLPKFSSDYRNQPDFALYSAGARVIRKETTESWSPKLKTFSGRILKKLGILQYPTNSPAVALDPYVNLGECWPMKGSNGVLAIKLARRIKPTGFAIEHVIKSLAIDLSSSPKELEVWGYALVDNSDSFSQPQPSVSNEAHSKDNTPQSENYLEGEFEPEQEIELDRPLEEENAFTLYRDDSPSDPTPSVPISKNSKEQQAIESKSQYKNGEYVHLASYRYKPSDSSPVQGFAVDPQVFEKLGSNVKINHIKLLIKSNWGNQEHTCIYRFSVFGE
ncbi:hypothetical protein BB560_006908 [Smittium megazygosporum]|uniref:SUN domain-containing protein n=1 Tax=Smittium megazygosporum TaxID=133381 RepID=A0A2T9Y0H4_9FUNG|nr:hypothetical protein BB560_006908 [Smittium megazygosporum]